MQKQLDAALSGKAKAKDPPNLVVISYDNLRSVLDLYLAWSSIPEPPAWASVWY
jgi:hypothetical protein